jgi:hypothetical protein
MPPFKYKYKSKFTRFTKIQMLSIFTATLACQILAAPTSNRSECRAPFMPVCNTNNLLYSSECQMMKIGNPFSVMWGKMTKDCISRSVVCPTYFMPVCDSQGRKFSDECEFAEAKAEQSKEYEFDVEQQKCIKRVCAAFLLPLCDAQGNMYGNECELRDANAEVSDSFVFSDGTCVPSAKN